MIYTSSMYRICAKGWAKGYGGLGGEDLEWGRGKCASLYTGSSVWDGLVVVWCVSVDTTVFLTFLSAPACTACTNMVYSKQLGRDVTISAKALLRLKTLASFLHRTWSVQFFFVRRTDKSCYVHAMCIMRLFWAKTSKTFAYFLRFDIKLKKSRSVFDLVTVLISKQSFFLNHVWPV